MGELTTIHSPDVLPVKSGGFAVEKSRAVAEIQASMVVAQGRPRDEMKCYQKVMKACERLSLASTAMYAYKRGGAMVEGPSIRLAEVLARAWGNITYGMREVSRTDGESEVEAFAWDLESNVKVSRHFVVRHVRDKKGGATKLTEERDVYEMMANMGQRRVRACLLELIPGDVVEEAVVKCKLTLAKGDGKPIEDRIRAMLVAFDGVGVNQEMIEKYLQHKVSAIVPAQLVKLQQIYQSINTGVAEREEFFDVSEKSGVNDLNSSLSSTRMESKKTEKEDRTAVDQCLAWIDGFTHPEATMAVFNTAWEKQKIGETVKQFSDLHQAEVAKAKAGIIKILTDRENKK